MLTINNLNVSYVHAKVLHDVSISIGKGQMAFLIGRNGAGKTTLLKTIMGLLKPLDGSISLLDEEVTGYAPEKLYKKGFRYVAQEKKVFSNLTVRENIEIAAYSNREPLDVALDKIFEIYPKLSRFLNLKAGQLSGGQRQILLVGQALVGTPKFLLIDEPTQGLDAVLIGEVIKILAKIKDRVSALIVEQNLSLVLHMADNIFILKEGKITKKIVDVSTITKTDMLEEYI